MPLSGGGGAPKVIGWENKATYSGAPGANNWADIINLTNVEGMLYMVRVKCSVQAYITVRITLDGKTPIEFAISNPPADTWCYVQELLTLVTEVMSCWRFFKSSIRVEAKNNTANTLTGEVQYGQA